MHIAKTEIQNYERESYNHSYYTNNSHIFALITNLRKRGNVK